MAEPWLELRSAEQNKLLQPACRDLANQLTWHGFKLSPDDWRHLICGTILGWRMVPGIDMGRGPAGLVMLGGSSRELRKSECTDAITLAFSIGDQPWAYDQSQRKPVSWCPIIRLARGIGENE